MRVETRTAGTDHGPAQQVRYQFSNHLGSATLELGDEAEVISYEEYFPFGATSYQAMANQTDVTKRYRYTGRERDDENALYYHGARYYAPWLGRWTACDPSGLKPGPNVYEYVRSNPLKFSDLNGADPTPAQPDLVAAKTEVGFKPLAPLFLSLSATPPTYTFAFAGRIELARNNLLTKPDGSGGPPTVISSGLYLDSGYLSLNKDTKTLGIGADVTLDRNFTGLGSFELTYRLQASVTPVGRESGGDVDLARFSGRVSSAAYGVSFSGDVRLKQPDLSAAGAVGSAGALAGAALSGKSVFDAASKLATGKYGLELNAKGRLELLNFIPVTWMQLHLGKSTDFSAEGLVAAPAGSLFPLTAPLIGIYTTHSEGGKGFEVLGGALVVPSIEGITAGKSGLEAFPTYGYASANYSLGKVGPINLKFGAEGALSLKELVSPTSQAMDFNQTYDALHGKAPDIPAAVKVSAGFSGTF